MPGSFFLDSPVSSKLDFTGASSQLFQSPQTPSASSSLCRSISGIGRKRSRYDRPSSAVEKNAFDSQFNFASPASLVNTDYRLAGGGSDDNIDQARLENRETPAELDYRPNRYRQHVPLHPIDASFESSTPKLNTIVSGNSRKRSRRSSEFSVFHSREDENRSRNSADSWSRTVLDVIGKVWDFCWSGSFRGFYAGGGRGYEMTTSSPLQVESNSRWLQLPSAKGNIITANTNRQQQQQQQQRKNNTLPSQYPVEKIQDNWVMVSNDRDHGLLNDANPSTAGSKRVHTNPFHPGRRRPVGTRLGKRTFISPSKPSTPIRNQVDSSTAESPVSVEAQRHTAKIRRIEREEDASIRRLNQQVQAMIKEGKEALGTYVEVEDSAMELEDFDD